MKSKQSSSDIPNKMFRGNFSLSDGQQIGNIFNDYFQSLFVLSQTKNIPTNNADVVNYNIL